MEKRTYPRVKFLKAGTYEISNLMGASGTFDAEILDMSHGGACIRTSRVLESGRVIRLNVDLKDADIRIPCIAEVVWSRSENSDYRVGLQFLI
ncbi:MAG: PilZ domain-containing protein [Deltaproteobacteria bacterium]|nr:PilZ domain-containing protein [Deltaproteobacteria bacterium]